MMPVLLALTVILETGIMHYADTSGQSPSLPPFAVDVLKTVPVVWEETKYLGGYPGKDVVIARKNRDRWYIAGINGENMDKELSIDLSQLGTIQETMTAKIVGNDQARMLISAHEKSPAWTGG